MTVRRHWLILGLAGVAAGVLRGQDGAEIPLVPALVTSPMPFIGITPCRIADTRDPNRPPGYGPPALPPGPPRSFTLAGQCGIPSAAVAVSLNVTSVNPQGNGYLVLYPLGGSQGVSTLNFLDRTVANAAIVPLGTGGAIAVAAGVSGTDLILDVNGYFGASASDGSNTFLAAGNATTTGLQNTGAGNQTLVANTSGNANTAAGWQCLLSNTTGTNNTAVGFGALKSNTTGWDNTATDDALSSNTTGVSNTAIGQGVLWRSTGNYNTAVGGAYGLTTGGSNTELGSFAGFFLTNGDHNLYVGLSADTAQESNTIRIADDNFYGEHTYVAGVRGAAVLADGLGVFIDTAFQLGTAFSSGRYKEDVHDMAEASRAILGLRPVAFRYKSQAGDRRQFGLLAEDVEAGVPDLVVRDPEGLPETVLYQELPAMLLNEMQKQAARLEAGEREILEERQRIERQREQARASQALIDELERRLALLESGGPSTNHR